MSTTSQFHLRALVSAAVHFVFCAVLGVTVFALAIADGWTDSLGSPTPWWITAPYCLLMVLSAPTAAFFGLWDDIHWTHSVSLSAALVLSIFVGYLISLVWGVALKMMIKRSSVKVHLASLK